MSGVKAAPGAWLYVVTLFVSAGLLFAVQPMLGKMMLPLVGGSPSGWLTALAFFQLALLAGYLLAHGLSRLSARGQAWATVGVLVLGFVQLPPGFGGTAGVENVGSAWGVLALLVRAIFVPYLGLATVSSGLQRLYAARAGAGSDPYFLYAASNAGSFVGLLAYPLVVEPLVPLSVQSVGWLVGYGLLVALIVALAWPRGGAATAATTTTTSAATVLPLSWRQRGYWVLLAFIPSSLSMGLTSLVTADLGSFPLLWVIPLGLYLLTFVIAFAQRRYLNSDVLALLQLACASMVLMIYGWKNGYRVDDIALVTLPFLAFFITALSCHTLLADKRPPENRLTEYYLWLAFGGALGGVFNVFIAPFIFNQAIEFLITLFVGLIVLPLKVSKLRLGMSIAGAIIVILSIAYLLSHNSTEVGAYFNLFGCFIIIGSVLAALSPMSLMGAALVVIALGTMPFNIYRPLDIKRDFFGVVKINDVTNDRGHVWRYFFHGTTAHGMQHIAPELNTEVASYYMPLRSIIAYYKPQNVGVIGLGAGIMLCMKAPGRQFTVYEISPLVIQMAKKWFTFVKDCGEPEWRVGDGRIELNQDKEKQFDLLFIDAFSSDSIPTHLITSEAIDLYLKRLSKNGLIAIHVTNRYYDLIGPLAALARNNSLKGLAFIDKVEDLHIGRIPSKWVILLPAEADETPLVALGWKALDVQGTSLWTDDFANLLSSLKIWQGVK